VPLIKSLFNILVAVFGLINRLGSRG